MTATPALLLSGLFALIAAEPPRLETAERIVFLGDSVTQAGTYVQDVECYLATRAPGRRRSVVNLGLGSETVSGLSESEHPWPRPDLHERLGRALKATRSDLVIAGYGINDGIYHPFDPERFAAFEAGITKLRAEVEAAGAAIVHITPLPFDPRPSAGKNRPKGAADYGFSHPFVDYERTMTQYSEWLVSREAQGWVVADPHRSAMAVLAGARLLDPTYAIAPDGVHPGPAGHWLIAEALLDALKAPALVDEARIDIPSKAVKAGAVEGLEFGEAGTVGFAWTTRVPFPHAPGWDRRPEGSRPVPDRFNVHRLAVLGLNSPRLTLIEDGKTVATFAREELAAGVDLSGLAALSTNRRSRAIRPLVAQRSEILAAAYRSAVGHKRPGVAPGLPLDEAKAQAEKLDAEIEGLARPVPVRLRLEPARP